MRYYGRITGVNTEKYELVRKLDEGAIFRVNDKEDSIFFLATENYNEELDTHLEILKDLDDRQHVPNLQILDKSESRYYDRESPRSTYNGESIVDGKSEDGVILHYIHGDKLHIEKHPGSVFIFEPPEKDTVVLEALRGTAVDKYVSLQSYNKTNKLVEEIKSMYEDEVDVVIYEKEDVYGF